MNSHTGDSQYKKDVDDILAVSYGLTDEQKMLAEFFDDKFNALPASVAHAAKAAELTVEDFVTMDLIGNDKNLKSENLRTRTS